MLGIFGKRVIDLAVLLLALYAFAFVPLGKHTGLEHLQRILATSAAKSAGHEIVSAGARLKDRLLDGEPPAPVPHGTDRLPKLPRGKPVNLLLAPMNDGPDASL